jgi:hypothetical protein
LHTLALNGGCGGAAMISAPARSAFSLPLGMVVMVVLVVGFPSLVVVVLN